MPCTCDSPSEIDPLEANVHTIQNVDIVVPLCRLLLEFNFESQLLMINTLLQLVEKSTFNKSICCNCNLTNVLLDMVPSLIRQHDNIEHYKRLLSKLNASFFLCSLFLVLFCLLVAYSCLFSLVLAHHRLDD